MNDSESRDEFVQLLTAAQPRLFNYLAVLLGNVHDASNVLQDANVTLWTKAGDFQPGTNFLSWAREVAYYKALAFTRDRNRDKLIVDQQLVEHALSRPEYAEVDPRRVALRHCLSELDERQVHLLRQRYRAGASIASIAQEEQKSEAAVKMVLRRLRLSLLGCIERRMAVAQ
jgi:RNA polymerase sigma-70 factor, ECF subfamily